MAPTAAISPKTAACAVFHSEARRPAVVTVCHALCILVYRAESFAESCWHLHTACLTPGGRGADMLTAL